MAMKCPYCGRQTLDNAAFCSVCGSRIPPMYAQPPPAIQKPLSEDKKMHETLLVVAVIITVIVAIAGVFVAVESGLLSSSQFSQDIHYRASGFSTIYVDYWGYVYNQGSTDAVAILHLQVFDGDDWHTFHDNVGAIAAGGSRYVEDTITLTHGDANAITIRCSITKG